MRITTKEECLKAAKQLDFDLLKDEASVETAPDSPPYCYVHANTRLRFNNNGDATGPCDSYNRVCICKKGKERSQSYSQQTKWVCIGLR